jgi:hypothetical protein
MTDMYRHYRTWILVVATALLALPALASDEVIPATSEDIEAFDRALTLTRQRENAEEQASSGIQAKTRTNAEIQDAKHAAEPAGDATRTKERVRTRTRTDEQLSQAVAEEAEKMKNAQIQAQKKAQQRTRERFEEQAEEGQGTRERARVMREYSAGAGRQQGQGGPPESPGEGSQGGASSDSGQQSGAQTGR